MNILDDERISKILMIVLIVLQIITISIVVLCSGCYEKEETKDAKIALVRDNAKDESVIDDQLSSFITVDIKGAVVNPGVYEIESDLRINDVVLLAGGLKSNASTKYINLSKKLSDEMVIYIYTTTQVKSMEASNINKEECVCPEVDISSCAGASSIVVDGNNSDSNEVSNVGVNSDKISINNASLEELMTLSGIGESKALAIIEYRTNNGKFTSLEEIMNVSGIGESAYSKIKEFIKL